MYKYERVPISSRDLASNYITATTPAYPETPCGIDPESLLTNGVLYILRRDDVDPCQASHSRP